AVLNRSSVSVGLRRLFTDATEGACTPDLLKPSVAPASFPVSFIGLGLGHITEAGKDALVAAIVILVVVLGRPEGRGLLDRSHDRTAEFLLRCLLGRLCFRRLPVVQCVDCG